MRLIDLTGKTFGNLIVIERDWEYQKRNNYEKPYWKCQCSCGKVVSILGKSLREGKTISCGCLAKERAKSINFIDITGQHFGKLTALEYIGNSKWKCQCDCGSMCITTTTHLTSGHTTSCGCLRSKGEMLISQWLNNQHIKYKKQYTNQNLRNDKGNMLKVDFAILNYQDKPIGFIEYNGRQHYDITDPWYNPEIEENLKIKKQYALIFDIPFLIISYKDDTIEKLSHFLYETIDYTELVLINEDINE